MQFVSPRNNGLLKFAIEGGKHLLHGMAEYDFGSHREFQQRAARKAFKLAKRGRVDAEERCHFGL